MNQHLCASALASSTEMLPKVPNTLNLTASVACAGLALLVSVARQSRYFKYLFCTSAIPLPSASLWRQEEVHAKITSLTVICFS